MTSRKRQSVLCLIVVSVALAILVSPGLGWPQTGDNETINFVKNTVHYGAITDVSGGELQLFAVAFLSSTPSTLTSFTTTTGTPINLMNVTESTVPVITLEVWYITWPASQLPITITPTATYSTGVYNAISSTAVANATLSAPYFEDVTTSAVNGNSPLNGQVAVASSLHLQRELFAFVAAVASIASSGTPTFLITRVGANVPIAAEDGTSKLTGSTTIQAAAISIITERDIGANGDSGDTIGGTFTITNLNRISNSNPISVVCIGLAVDPQPPTTRS